MVAPTPVSALLHAVAVVKVGVFSVVRIMLFVFGLDVLSYFGLGLPTALFASFYGNNRLGHSPHERRP